jgi:hypothetical protein
VNCSHVTSLDELHADQIGTWTHISRGIEAAVWDAANRVKDRQDEALDAMRVSGGMTLDQFLGQK